MTTDRCGAPCLWCEKTCQLRHARESWHTDLDDEESWHVHWIGILEAEHYWAMDEADRVLVSLQGKGR